MYMSLKNFRWFQLKIKPTMLISKLQNSKLTRVCQAQISVETTYAIVRFTRAALPQTMEEKNRSIVPLFISLYRRCFTRVVIWRCYSIVSYIKTIFFCFSIDIVDSPAVIGA